MRDCDVKFMARQSSIWRGALLPLKCRSTIKTTINTPLEDTDAISLLIFTQSFIASNIQMSKKTTTTFERFLEVNATVSSAPPPVNLLLHCVTM
jgi:hypothetical protein